MSTERTPLSDRELWQSLATDRSVAPAAVSEMDFAAWLEGRGWAVAGVVPSPITGPEGNVEFLLAATRFETARTETARIETDHVDHA